jgi:hypothetical protein
MHVPRARVVTGAAHCQCCDWTAAGTPADTDKAAEQHTRKTGHAAATATTPGAAT